MTTKANKVNKYVVETIWHNLHDIKSDFDCALNYNVGLKHCVSIGNNIVNNKLKFVFTF